MRNIKACKSPKASTHKTASRKAKSKPAMTVIKNIADMQEQFIKTARANTTRSFNKALAAIEAL